MSVADFVWKYALKIENAFIDMILQTLVINKKCKVHRKFYHPEMQLLMDGIFKKIPWKEFKTLQIAHASIFPKLLK